VDRATWRPPPSIEPDMMSRNSDEALRRRLDAGTFTWRGPTQMLSDCAVGANLFSRLSDVGRPDQPADVGKEAIRKFYERLAAIPGFKVLSYVPETNHLTTMLYGWLVW
jgi:hypothetical protein